MLAVLFEEQMLVFSTVHLCWQYCLQSRYQRFQQYNSAECTVHRADACISNSTFMLAVLFEELIAALSTV